MTKWTRIKDLIKKYKVFIELLVSIIFISILVTKFLDMNNFTKEIEQTNYILLLYTLIFTLLSWIFRAIRWREITTIYKQISIKDSLKFYLIGVYYGSITPGKIGEFVKGLSYAKKYGISKQNGLASVFFEKVFDIIVFVIFVGSYLLTKNLLIMIVCSLVLTPIIWTIFVKLGIKTHNIPFLKKINFPKINLNKELFLITITSVITWICFSIVAFIILKSLNVTIPITYLLYCVSLAVIITIIPISFNGWGLRESAYVFLLKDFISPNISIFFSVLFVFLTTYFLAILGLITKLSKVHK